jgi:hypothetical protein
MCIYIYRNSWTVPLICRKISTNEFISWKKLPWKLYRTNPFPHFLKHD